MPTKWEIPVIKKTIPVNPFHYYDRELNFENTHKIKTAWKAFIVADEAARYSRETPDEHPYLITMKQALADSIYDRLTKVAFHIQKYHLAERTEEDYEALKRDFKWHKKMRRLEWIREFDEDSSEVRRIKEYAKEDFKAQTYGGQDLTKEFKDVIDYGIHIAKSDGRLYRQTGESDEITDGIIDEYLIRVLMSEPTALNKLRFNKPTQYKVARIFAQIMNKYIADDKFAFEWREAE